MDCHSYAHCCGGGLFHLDQTGQTEEARAKVAEMMDYLEAWDGKGISYDSSFLRTRIEYRFLKRHEVTMIKKAPVDGVRVYEFKDHVTPVRNP